jgi:hypothetical protein
MATRSGAPVALPQLPRLRGPAIPTADARAFTRVVRRTRALRVVLALALAGLVAAAFLTARGLHIRQGGFLPAGSTGVVVFDLSMSVSPESNRRISGVLRQIVDSDEPVGFVAFSDTAYELVPPGTPGSELRPLLRYFEPRRLSPQERSRLEALGQSPNGPEGRFLINPWVTSFRGGTRISAGLRLAREMLDRDHVANGSVLLISDLDYSPYDFGTLTDELLTYKRDNLPLRIVALFPTFFDREVFARMLGGNAIVRAHTTPPRFTGQSKAFLGGNLPTGLLALGVLVAVLLAANELACGRLRWGERGMR